MSKSHKIGLLLVVILIILVAFVWIEAETHFIQELISSAVYDNKMDYISCEELPPLSEVQRIMEDQKGVIQQIESIDPGLILVYIDSSCPGKGSLVIEYPSHADRLQIEELIGNTFFGIPWKGINN